MSALILLSDYRMKKNNSARKESEALVDLKTMHEFRGEMVSHFLARDKQFVQIEKRFKEVDARFDQLIAEVKAISHRTALLVEEQNLRNKQSYDGYIVMFEALQEFRASLKPECF